MSKTVLVTGASSGIGKSIALYLSSKGFNVYGTSRNPENYDVNKFKLLKCDITDIEHIKNTVSHIVKKEGRLDVLINNAGIGITGPMEETAESDIKSAFETNFFGPINIIKQCIPSMRRHKTGLIINITSIMGYFALPYRGVYSATKSSMEIVGEAFSMELNKFNIKVVNIAPGDFKTEIISRRINSPSLPGSLYKKDYKKSINSANNQVKNALSPDIISKLVYKIIKTKKPKIHYKVGTFIQKFSIVLKSILPDRLFENILLYYNKN